MRILWVKVGGLWPVNTGGRLRTFNIIHELSREHEVTVIGSHHPDEDGGALKKNLPFCRDVISVPFASPKITSPEFVKALVRSWTSEMPVDLYKFQIPAVRREVSQALASGKFDVCIADFLVALPNIPSTTKVPLIYFSHNVEHMIWKRLSSNESNPVKRLLLEIEWRKMRRYEALAAERVDLTIAVSEEDRALLADLAPRGRSAAIPTGVDIDYFRPGDAALEKPLELVFTGSMDWAPNDDAILYFMTEILPLVQRRAPAVHLTVVGRNPGARLKEAAFAAGVTVTGTVDDIRPWVDSASVYIVPLRIGGGTRLKIFEALAMGKAIVSTTIGAEGLPLEEGVHVLRADDPHAFADAILTLLEDPALRQRLGKAGRQLVEERYSWKKIAEVFEQRCREALPDRNAKKKTNLSAASAKAASVISQ